MELSQPQRGDIFVAAKQTRIFPSSRGAASLRTIDIVDPIEPENARFLDRINRINRILSDKLANVC